MVCRRRRRGLGTGGLHKRRGIEGATRRERARTAVSPCSCSRKVRGGEWASLARVPVGALRGSPALDFFYALPPI